MFTGRSSIIRFWVWFRFITPKPELVPVSVSSQVDMEFFPPLYSMKYYKNDKLSIKKKILYVYTNCKNVKIKVNTKVITQYMRSSLDLNQTYKE